MSNTPNAPYLEQIIAVKKALRATGNYQLRFAAIQAIIAPQVAEVRKLGQTAIPAIEYTDLAIVSSQQQQQIRKRGCVIIRNVFERSRVDNWNAMIDTYLHSNDYTGKSASKQGLDKYFSNLASSKPQIYSVYWSKPQIQARQSQELAQTRQWLNHLWQYQYDGRNVFNPDQECSYADRIRQREPGDATLGLSPHIDGGTIERWIDTGYRQVYRHVFDGDIHEHNPFAAAYRTQTTEIPSPAVCSMFRTFQGWTALSSQGPGEGTLNLVPIADAMSWVLLRALQDDVGENDLCGFQAGRAMTMVPQYHQLLLDAYVPIPRVNAGDTVWWHPDVIHGVENQHNGDGYSNVMYIGAAPDCQKNKDFLTLQSPAFESGKSCPDFAPEHYEVDFANRATTIDLTDIGRKQMGYA